MSVPNDPQELLNLSKKIKCPDPECPGYMDWYWVKGEEQHMCEITAQHLGGVKIDNIGEVIRQRKELLEHQKATTPRTARYAATIIMLLLFLLVVCGFIAGIHALIKGL